MNTRPFTTDTAFQRRMAEGHEVRLGHKLEGYYTVDSEGISHLHRTCCIPKD